VTGVDAISIAGQPTPWLIELIALAIVGAVVWLAAASLVGSLVDIWLIQMAMEPGRQGRSRGGFTLPPPRRSVAARGDPDDLPGAAASRFAWAATRIFNATYNELTTPSNLASPLPLRVVLAAGDAVAVVTVVWLATETIAAIASGARFWPGGAFWSVLGGRGADRAPADLDLC
jgi:hypothetical protein